MQYSLVEHVFLYVGEYWLTGPFHLLYKAKIPVQA
jgi:hypothetical protein